MNIGEANAVNVILRTLLDEAGPFDVDDRLVEAAVLLATNANKALGAGLTGHEVRGRLA